MKINKRGLMLLLALTFSLGLQAQNLLIALSDGSNESFPVSQVRSIKFGTCTMILRQQNGTVNAWNLDAIQSYSFSSTTQTAGSQVESSSLQVFPNPAADVVQVSYHNPTASEISVSLIDASGKELAQIFKGPHQGNQKYECQVGKIPAGSYFIQIISATKTITKPIVIQ